MGSFNAGSVLNSSGKAQQALALLNRAEKEGYTLYSLNFQRGLALQALGRSLDAQHEFERSMQLSPASPTREILWLQRGRLALQNKDPETAIGDLEKYVAYDPAHAEARYLLAMACISNGEFERALKVLDGAPASAGNHYARAMAWHALKRKREAADEIDAAVRANPRSAMLREWQAKIHAMP